MIQHPACFTMSYIGLSRVLQSEAHLGKPFDMANPPNPVNPTTCGATKFTAIWDTGATSSVITQNAINICGLKPSGVAVVKTPNGERQTASYLASIFLPNHVALGEIRFVEGTVTGSDILIGMDIIGTGDFAVTNFGGKTTFTFRLPSCDCIDFVKQPPPRSSKPAYWNWTPYR